MKLLTTLCLLLVYTTAGHAAEFTGRVVNPDGEPLPGVSLTTRLSTVGTLTDTDGRFTLTCPDSGVSWVTFSSVGYQSRQFDLAKLPPTIVLDPRYYREGDIIVTGDRAQAGLTPIAFDNVSEDDIARDYTVGEFPLLLEGTPNLYAYSDAGTPLGYSYIRIRGFDDKRIATYINGVPLNDPEDQSTYFTDLPDFAANITDIQVQRGVGNSLYGDASFGGSINIVTSNLSLDRNVTLSSGYGVYTSDGDVVSDIYKQSIEYASGLIDGRWLFSGRFSKQKTGGYRYNSWYEGWSYYFSMARLDPNMTTELYIYGGPIRMHLSYWGEYREVIEADRRANPLTYDNETDNFNQPHYHLHNTYKLSDRMTLSNTSKSTTISVSTGWIPHWWRSIPPGWFGSSGFTRTRLAGTRGLISSTSADAIRSAARFTISRPIIGARRSGSRASPIRTTIPASATTSTTARNMSDRCLPRSTLI